MISTAVMVKLGHVYGNLMVNVQPTNRKLEDRARRIIQAATGVSYDRATELLDLAGRSVRVAIIMQQKQIPREKAEILLARANGRIREALALG
jgi:N-acetylmuramic acid 6-phosphate etherase